MIVMLRDVRLSFPRLFEAEQYNGQGAFNYSCKFLVRPGSEADIAVINAVESVVKEMWPKKAETMLSEFRPDKKSFPYIDGKRVEFEGAEGTWVLTAKRKQDSGRPTVLDSDKTPLVAGDGKPYAGCYVNASVEFWAQDGDTKGVRCTLRGLQFLRDGDAFGGGSSASAEEFDDLSDIGSLV